MRPEGREPLADREGESTLLSQSGEEKGSDEVVPGTSAKYNPYYKVRGRVLLRPEGSEEYLDRKVATPYMIRKGDLCYRLFKKHGFYWGGDWLGSKDYQHFEK